MAKKSEGKGRIGKDEYAQSLAPLQLELNGMARWLHAAGKRLLVVIEDAMKNAKSDIDFAAAQGEFAAMAAQIAAIQKLRRK